MKSGRIAYIIARELLKLPSEIPCSTIVEDKDHKNRMLMLMNNGEQFEIVVRNCSDISRYIRLNESVVS